MSAVAELLVFIITVTIGMITMHKAAQIGDRQRQARFLDSGFNHGKAATGCWRANPTLGEGVLSYRLAFGPLSDRRVVRRMRYKVLYLSSSLSALGLWTTGWNFICVSLKYIDPNHVYVISTLFQSFISHVTASESEIKLFQPLKEFWNYFKIISATMNMLEIFTSCNKPKPLK